MPPKATLTKEDIIAASMNIIRQGGISALNARALADGLKCSTHPIFRLYASMDEVKEDVISAIVHYYNAFFDKNLKRDDIPPYKASAWGYIQFAKDEKEFFKVLFMRDRTPKQMAETDRSFTIAVEMIMQATGFDEAAANKFHLEMWVYAHGIASLLVTSYLDLSDTLISEMLSDAYLGLRGYYEQKAKSEILTEKKEAGK